MTSKAISDVSPSPFRKAPMLTGCRGSAIRPPQSQHQHQQSQQVNMMYMQNSNGSASQQLPSPHLADTNFFEQQQQSSFNNNHQQLAMISRTRNLSENRVTSINSGHVPPMHHLRGGSMTRSNSNLGATPQKRKESSLNTPAKTSPRSLGEQQLHQQHQVSVNRLLPSKIQVSSQSSTSLRPFANNNSNSSTTSASSYAKENQNNVVVASNSQHPAYFKHSNSPSISKTAHGLGNSQKSGLFQVLSSSTAMNVSAATGSNCLNVSGTSNTPNNNNTSYNQSLLNSSSNYSHSPSSRTLNNSHQNVLGQSWKVNVISGQTPKKSKAASGCPKNSHTMSQRDEGRVGLLSPHSPMQSQRMNLQQQQQLISQRQSSSHRAFSPAELRRPDSSCELLHRQDDCCCANVKALKGDVSIVESEQSYEVKKFKQEIDQFKNREIKYLVRIATLEREAKKLAETAEASTAAATHRHNNQANSSIYFHHHQQSSCEETRNRNKTDEDSSSIHEWNANRSSMQAAAMTATDSEYKVKFIHLQGQHKNIAQLLLTREQEFAELAQETALLRKLLTKQQQQTVMTPVQQNHSTTPSMLKALALSQAFSR